MTTLAKKTQPCHAERRSPPQANHEKMTPSPDSSPNPSNDKRYLNRTDPSWSSLAIGEKNLESRTPASRQINGRIEPEGNDNASLWLLLLSLVLMGIGMRLNLSWLGFSGSLIAIFLSGRIVLPAINQWFSNNLTSRERRILLGFLAFFIAIAGMIRYFGIYSIIGHWLNQFKYDEFGSWAEWVGALGQISIAILAVYVAWTQYVISKELTIQQNRITQQQTIDAYFQGISDLALDDEGLLEDWPQERAIAEGRTAAILSSVDGGGESQNSEVSVSSKTP